MSQFNFLPPHFGFVLQTARKVPSWVRYSISCGILGIFFIIWYGVLFLPIQSIISGQLKHIEKLKKECQLYSQLESKLHEHDNRCKELTKQVKQAIEDQTGGSDRMTFVFDCLSQSGLQLNSYQPQKSVDKVWYERQRVAYSFTGSFRNVLDFFRTLQSSKKLLQCKEFSITSSNEGSLQVQCILECIILKEAHE